MVAAFTAPLIAAGAIVCIVHGKHRVLGQQLLLWGALGAATFALADVVLGELLNSPATISGAAFGAGAGFSAVSCGAAVARRWRGIAFVFEKTSR